MSLISQRLIDTQPVHLQKHTNTYNLSFIGKVVSGQRAQKLPCKKESHIVQNGRKGGHRTASGFESIHQLSDRPKNHTLLGTCSKLGICTGGERPCVCKSII